MWRARNIVFCCLAIAASTAVSVGQATAAVRHHRHKHHHHKHARKAVDSSLTLDSVNADGFAGRLSAAQGACRGQRGITVYMVNTDASVPSAVPFGTAITRSDGSWELGGWAYPGEYYAVAAKRKTGNLTCDGATSNTRTWWTTANPGQ